MHSSGSFESNRQMMSSYASLSLSHSDEACKYDQELKGILRKRGIKQCWMRVIYFKEFLQRCGDMQINAKTELQAKR